MRDECLIVFIDNMYNVFVNSEINQSVIFGAKMKARADFELRKVHTSIR